MDTELGVGSQESEAASREPAIGSSLATASLAPKYLLLGARRLYCW